VKHRSPCGACWAAKAESLCQFRLLCCPRAGQTVGASRSWTTSVLMRIGNSGHHRVSGAWPRLAVACTGRCRKRGAA
jgi:hypothetical protein